MQKDTENTTCNQVEKPSTDPLLNSLYIAWPNLPQNIKDAIKALINTHIGHENETTKQE
jgi:hypothetical protein